MQKKWTDFFVKKNYAVMGILNVTPDSFSDGGLYQTHDAAFDKAMQMVADGADIIDVGGESTRPDAKVISVGQEIERVLPVIERLAKENIVVSIDTRNAQTMAAALRAGAVIVNDVSALRHDEKAIEIVASSDCLLCLMHMQGTPQTMQINPHYDDVVGDVFDFLKERITFCESQNIQIDRLAIDVGIGFGKTLDHNLDLMRHTADFTSLGACLLYGTSRKRFIAALDNDAAADRRLGGSIASILYTYCGGARIFRVHDVFESVQALKTFAAIENRA